MLVKILLALMKNERDQTYLLVDYLLKSLITMRSFQIVLVQVSR